MTQEQKTFDIDKDHYLHLTGLICKKSCDDLTAYLLELSKLNLLWSDSQCPGSGAITSDYRFDEVLEQLLPHVEQITGKNLYPTYAYARLYNYNENLYAHVDRPSCEISLTLTLGYFGNPWPFWVGELTDDNTRRQVLVRTDEGEEIRYVKNEVQITMDVGDAIIYKGTDLLHWRYPYTEGRNQAQVFLHYVDANGIYAEHKYDGRDKLAHHYV